ncbi:hypothetical protein HFO56_01340 [Rhizobium laguerreae]|uniref:hypothetical protein n=1 Tax=Rhizobium laguerreae TaxID=1076926 RepID=UPI001C91DB4D|nr:hypothetical protein [Rhizobium laguerreae]MBY3151053.1 hypothetical protein [Rhizobium laguerreae]MBY3433244.1 hypothetical protein [Rhizobium laguerreae]
MARDLIVRNGIATLVHDEPDLKVKSLVVHSDGLYARSDDGLAVLGQITPALKKDLDGCDLCFVVLMQGHRVMKTTKARLQKER